jgi:hypothetical protein
VSVPTQPHRALWSTGSCMSRPRRPTGSIPRTTRSFERTFWTRLHTRESKSWSIQHGWGDVGVDRVRLLRLVDTAARRPPHASVSASLCFLNVFSRVSHNATFLVAALGILRPPSCRIVLTEPAAGITRNQIAAADRLQETNFQVRRCVTMTLTRGFVCQGGPYSSTTAGTRAACESAS